MIENDDVHPDPAYVGNSNPCDFGWVTTDVLHSTGENGHNCARKQGHAQRHRCGCGAEK